MNEGVEILLARMDSHPEEFHDKGPWTWVTDAVLGECEARAQGVPSDIYQRVAFMTDEELAALRDKYQKIQAAKFTSRVMGQLLNPPEKDAPKRKIVLTRQQLDMAKDLGITPTEYAQELVKLKAAGRL